MSNDADLKRLEQAFTSAPSYDGLPATLVHLKNSHGMTLSVMDVGATWLSCRLPLTSGFREVLLHAPDMTAHLKQTAYFGAIAGRYANRIDASQFSLGDRTYSLCSNEGKNTLHGGKEGFDKRRWTIATQSHNAVTFHLDSEDGDQGFPGNLSASVTYLLDEDNRVEIRYQAECDRACPINLTNHAYFNLAGAGSGVKSLDHILMMEASYYLPTRKDLIPTGAWNPVSETAFDFSEPKVIGRDFLSDEDQKIARGYDHAFILDPDVCDGEALAVSLLAPDRSVIMKVSTTKPAIQFYSGNFLQGTPGEHGDYENFDGLALETQYLPDGPNHPEWGEKSGIHQAYQPYQHRTVYQFLF
ncbi:galactose-1-epimerase [Grimontia sp. S25]|uniref:Aldose 1-epimerase n=1 Tax=Grimontia sedimenti TaxID=2711294 RepID=A0A6M1R8R8_9GAMM|nr:galactose-1-epimerase [Grimontia sedimenti]NGN98815.1 galactose-1-epimerase [Grimontia sedimenti]